MPSKPDEKSPSFWSSFVVKNSNLTAAGIARTSSSLSAAGSKSSPNVVEDVRGSPNVVDHPRVSPMEFKDSRVDVKESFVTPGVDVTISRDDTRTSPDDIVDRKSSPNVIVDGRMSPTAMEGSSPNAVVDSKISPNVVNIADARHSPSDVGVKSTSIVDLKSTSIVDMTASPLVAFDTKHSPPTKSSPTVLDPKSDSKKFKSPELRSSDKAFRTSEVRSSGKKKTNSLEKGSVGRGSVGRGSAGRASGSMGRGSGSIAGRTSVTASLPVSGSKNAKSEFRSPNASGPPSSGKKLKSSPRGGAQNSPDSLQNSQSMLGNSQSILENSQAGSVRSAKELSSKALSTSYSTRVARAQYVKAQNVRAANIRAQNSGGQKLVGTVGGPVVQKNQEGKCRPISFIKRNVQKAGTGNAKLDEVLHKKSLERYVPIQNPTKNSDFSVITEEDPSATVQSVSLQATIECHDKDTLTRQLFGNSHPFDGQNIQRILGNSVLGANPNQSPNAGISKRGGIRQQAGNPLNGMPQGDSSRMGGKMFNPICGVISPSPRAVVQAPPIGDVSNGNAFKPRSIFNIPQQQPLFKPVNTIENPGQQSVPHAPPAHYVPNQNMTYAANQQYMPSQSVPYAPPPQYTPQQRQYPFMPQIQRVTSISGPIPTQVANSQEQNAQAGAPNTNVNPTQSKTHFSPVNMANMQGISGAAAIPSASGHIQRPGVIGILSPRHFPAPAFNPRIVSPLRVIGTQSVRHNMQHMQQHEQPMMAQRNMSQDIIPNSGPLMANNPMRNSGMRNTVNVQPSLNRNTAALRASVAGPAVPVITISGASVVVGRDALAPVTREVRTSTTTGPPVVVRKGTPTARVLSPTVQGVRGRSPTAQEVRGVSPSAQGVRGFCTTAQGLSQAGSGINQFSPKLLKKKARPSGPPRGAVPPQGVTRQGSVNLENSTTKRGPPNRRPAQRNSERSERNSRNSLDDGDVTTKAVEDEKKTIQVEKADEESRQFYSQILYQDSTVNPNHNLLYTIPPSTSKTGVTTRTSCATSQGYPTMQPYPVPRSGRVSTGTVATVIKETEPGQPASPVVAVNAVVVDDREGDITLDAILEQPNRRGSMDQERTQQPIAHSVPAPIGRGRPGLLTNFKLSCRSVSPLVLPPLTDPPGANLRVFSVPKFTPAQAQYVETGLVKGTGSTRFLQARNQVGKRDLNPNVNRDRTLPGAVVTNPSSAINRTLEAAQFRSASAFAIPAPRTDSHLRLVPFPAIYNRLTKKEIDNPLLTQILNTTYAQAEHKRQLVEQTNAKLMNSMKGALCESRKSAKEMLMESAKKLQASCSPAVMHGENPSSSKNPRNLQNDRRALYDSRRSLSEKRPEIGSASDRKYMSVDTAMEKKRSRGKLNITSKPIGKDLKFFGVTPRGRDEISRHRSFSPRLLVPPIRFTSTFPRPAPLVRKLNNIQKILGKSTNLLHANLLTIAQDEETVEEAEQRTVSVAERPSALQEQSVLEEPVAVSVVKTPIENVSNVPIVTKIPAENITILPEHSLELTLEKNQADSIEDTITLQETAYEKSQEERMQRWARVNQQAENTGDDQERIESCAENEMNENNESIKLDVPEDQTIPDDQPSTSQNHMIKSDKNTSGSVREYCSMRAFGNDFGSRLSGSVSSRIPVPLSARLPVSNVMVSRSLMEDDRLPFNRRSDEIRRSEMSQVSVLSAVTNAKNRISAESVSRITADPVNAQTVQTVEKYKTASSQNLALNNVKLKADVNLTTFKIGGTPPEQSTNQKVPEKQPEFDFRPLRWVMPFASSRELVPTARASGIASTIGGEFAESFATARGRSLERVKNLMSNMALPSTQPVLCKEEKEDEKTALPDEAIQRLSAKTRSRSLTEIVEVVPPPNVPAAKRSFGEIQTNRVLEFNTPNVKTLGERVSAHKLNFPTPTIATPGLLAPPPVVQQAQQVQQQPIGLQFMGIRLPRPEFQKNQVITSKVEESKHILEKPIVLGTVPPAKLSITASKYGGGISGVTISAPITGKQTPELVADIHGQPGQQVCNTKNAHTANDSTEQGTSGLNSSSSASCSGTSGNNSSSASGTSGTNSSSSASGTNNSSSASGKNSASDSINQSSATLLVNNAVVQESQVSPDSMSIETKEIASQQESHADPPGFTSFPAAQRGLSDDHGRENVDASGSGSSRAGGSLGADISAVVNNSSAMDRPSIDRRQITDPNENGNSQGNGLSHSYESTQWEKSNRLSSITEGSNENKKLSESVSIDINRVPSAFKSEDSASARPSDGITPSDLWTSSPLLENSVAINPPLDASIPLNSQGSIPPNSIPMSSSGMQSHTQALSQSNTQSMNTTQTVNVDLANPEISDVAGVMNQTADVGTILNESQCALNNLGQSTQSSPDQFANIQIRSPNQIGNFKTSTRRTAPGGSPGSKGSPTFKPRPHVQNQGAAIRSPHISNGTVPAAKKKSSVVKCHRPFGNVTGNRVSDDRGLTLPKNNSRVNPFRESLEDMASRKNSQVDESTITEVSFAAKESRISQSGGLSARSPPPLRKPGGSARYSNVDADKTGAGGNAAERRTSIKAAERRISGGTNAAERRISSGANPIERGISAGERRASLGTFGEHVDKRPSFERRTSGTGQRRLSTDSMQPNGSFAISEATVDVHGDGDAHGEPRRSSISETEDRM